VQLHQVRDGSCHAGSPRGTRKENKKEKGNREGERKKKKRSKTFETGGMAGMSFVVLYGSILLFLVVANAVFFVCFFLFFLCCFLGEKA